MGDLPAGGKGLLSTSGVSPDLPTRTHSECHLFEIWLNRGAKNNQKPHTQHKQHHGTAWKEFTVTAAGFHAMWGYSEGALSHPDRTLSAPSEWRRGRSSETKLHGNCGPAGPGAAIHPKSAVPAPTGTSRPGGHGTRNVKSEIMARRHPEEVLHWRRFRKTGDGGLRKRCSFSLVFCFFLKHYSHRDPWRPRLRVVPCGG